MKNTSESYSFHPEALLEADEAAKFYEENQGGLGNRFIESLTDAVNRIRRNPSLYQKIYKNIRKCRMTSVSVWGYFSRSKRQG